MAAILLAQYVVVFGWSYAMYRFLGKGSPRLKTWRKMARVFGGFAACFVLLIQLVLQVVSRKSWSWPFLAAVWVLTVFIVHDLALGLAIKKTCH